MSNKTIEQADTRDYNTSVLDGGTPTKTIETGSNQGPTYQSDLPDSPNTPDSPNPPDGTEVGGLLDFLQQQQVMNAGLLANFFTSGNSNVCDALLEIKEAIDTNSKCLLRICDAIESKVSPNE